jgi:putative membrane protein
MTDAALAHAITRPDERLMKYYLVTSLMAGPFFFLPLIPLYFRYHTMRYRFDEDGISMKWGILFRREINLTYSRIQDIHLTSNLIERWFGLARIQVQTASGRSDAEMTIEGIPEFEMLRDYLYTRMRGVSTAHAPSSVQHHDDLGSTLSEIAAEMREIRRLIAERPERS